MEGEELYCFYKAVILPLFGIDGEAGNITWKRRKLIEPSLPDAAYYFSIGKQEYVLIFEEHHGLGYNQHFIRENVLRRKYHFVQPIVEDYIDGPTYMGLGLLAPHCYVANVIGSFTLLAVE